MNNNLEQRTNVLFLSAPYPGNQKFAGQPTGLLYALSVLADRKEHEYKSRAEVAEEIKVWCPNSVPDFDSSEFKQELIDYLTSKKPKLVGISTFSVSYQNAVAVRDLVKQISPETVVVFGGAHEDNYVKQYRERESIDSDFVVAGDGSYLLDELYKIVEENPDATITEIKKKVVKEKERFGELRGAGVLLFNDDNDLVEVFTQRYIADSIKREPVRLDQLPIIQRYLLKDEDDLSRQFDIFGDKKTAQVMVGQGCPYSCGFCSEGIKKTWFDEDSPRSINSARDLSHLEKELMALERNGYETIFFDDSTFFARSKSYMRGVLALLKKYDFEWGCQTTQNSIHNMKDLLGEMKESGLKYVYIGIEHYDGQLRDSFGKSIGGGNKFNGYAIEDTLDLLTGNEISVGVSLTFGHPDPFSKDEVTRESETTIKYAIDRTSELISKYKNIEGVSLNLITYHPGTPISERYEQKVGSIDYTGLPNNSEPFNQFEEGIGQHPKGMTSNLAEYVLTYARDNLGKKLWI